MLWTRESFAGGGGIITWFSTSSSDPAVTSRTKNKGVKYGGLFFIFLLFCMNNKILLWVGGGRGEGKGGLRVGRRDYHRGGADYCAVDNKISLIRAVASAKKGGHFIFFLILYTGR